MTIFVKKIGLPELESLDFVKNNARIDDFLRHFCKNFAREIDKIEVETSQNGKTSSQKSHSSQNRDFNKFLTISKPFFGNTSASMTEIILE